VSNEAEIWSCDHTRKCGWEGRQDDLLQVPDRAMGPGVTQGVCPKCGNDEFYVREPIPDLLDCVHGIVKDNETYLSKTSSGDWWKGRPEMFIGALTKTVASKLQKPQSQVRYWLTKLEASGALIAYRTRGGMTRWYPSKLLNRQPSTIN